jgi:E3 ubiquitin-protein ligase UBR3
MWVRNGMQMRGQAMTFIQNHFCSSFSDADLFLIQCLSTKLDSILFMNILLERFHLTRLLTDLINKREKSIKNSKSNEIISNIVDEMLDEFVDTSSTSTSTTTASSSGSTPSTSSLNSLDNLEASHQAAMLIGALTLIAQILLIKPNLKLKSYSLTRTEIVNLLCVSDRTFSQIEENLPDICSLTSAKKYIQPILDECAEFLQPTLDALSIGSLKQGRYKPKDEIWLREYDPLYVMLRSVKRREFQESFDRYTQFVEKHLAHMNKSKKKNLWPPFRLPQLNHDSTETDSKEKENYLRVDKELVSKWNILNSKQLHALILNLLYEHYYAKDSVKIIMNNDKIFYLIIYILELGVFMGLNLKLNTNESNDSSKSIDDQTYDELNYDTWFSGNDLAENICTHVPFSKYEKKSNEASVCDGKDVIEYSRFNQQQENMEVSNERQTTKRLPPHKKMRSSIETFF